MEEMKVWAVIETNIDELETPGGFVSDGSFQLAVFFDKGSASKWGKEMLRKGTYKIAQCKISELKTA
jgi:hypothetical protein